MQAECQRFISLVGMALSGTQWRGNCWVIWILTIPKILAFLPWHPMTKTYLSQAASTSREVSLPQTLPDGMAPTGIHLVCVSLILKIRFSRWLCATTSFMREAFGPMKTASASRCYNAGMAGLGVHWAVVSITPRQVTGA